MDNAIEACRKLPEDIYRRIEIEVRYKNNRLAIRISNTSELVEIIDNHCVTTKQDKLLHGYGLSNIQKIVDENNGNMVLQYKDSMFKMSIIFLL